MARNLIKPDTRPVTYMTVSRACRIHGIAPSRFGRSAIGDPRLIFDMRDGRTLRSATEARVRQFIAGLEG